MSNWERVGYHLEKDGFEIYSNTFYPTVLDITVFDGCGRLDHHFEDRKCPTAAERGLWEIEFGIDYPEQELLESFFNKDGRITI